MKRTAMKRTSGLRRKTPLRARSLTKKYALRERDEAYLAWVRTQECACRQGVMGPDGEYRVTPCSGRIEADHLGEHGMGQKAHDRTASALCSQHHRDRTDYAGVFRGFDGKAMRIWCGRSMITTANLYVAWQRVRTAAEKAAAMLDGEAT